MGWKTSLPPSLLPGSRAKKGKNFLLPYLVGLLNFFGFREKSVKIFSVSYFTFSEGGINLFVTVRDRPYRPGGSAPGFKREKENTYEYFYFYRYRSRFR